MTARTFAELALWSLHGRERVILDVMNRLGLPRAQVAEEVDRQLLEDVDGFAGETVEEAVGMLAYYCSPGLYAQVRADEALRLGIWPETLDELVEAERDRLARVAGAATGIERRRGIARLAGKLLRCGIDLSLVYELSAGWNATRCHPPLPARELQETLDWVSECERRKAAA